MKRISIVVIEDAPEGETNKLHVAYNITREGVGWRAKPANGFEGPEITTATLSFMMSQLLVTIRPLMEE